MIPNNFLEEGKKKEAEFASDFCKARGLSSSLVEEASKEDDIYRHIDIWIDWIVLRNVNGEKGRLFGQADYIVFELGTSWCVCPRISLIRSLKGKIDFSSFTTDREAMFKVYRRKGRLDAIVKVDSTFLVKIPSSFIIPKE